MKITARIILGHNVANYDKREMFQMQSEYGVDLGSQLAEQAVGELA